MRGPDFYQNNPFPFPDDDVNPADKRNKPEWMLKVAQAIWSCYVKNECGFRHDDYKKFEELRSYAQGRQSPLKYQRMLSARENASDLNAAGYENITYEIFSPMPKYMNWLRQKFDLLKHRPRVRSLSKEAGQEKSEKKWRAYMYSEHGKFLDEFDKKAGLNIDRPEYIPASYEELQIFNEIKGFKTKAEIAMNDFLKYTDIISDFPEIKPKLFDDGVTIGAMVAMDYTDLYTGQVKNMYINPGRYVGEYSVTHGFKKSPYGAHWEFMLLSDVRKQFNIDEDELKSIAVQFSNVTNRPYSWGEYDVEYDNGRWSAYDTIKVPVLIGEYKTVDTTYKRIYKNKFGSERLVDSEWGEVVNDKRNSTQVDSVQTVYRFKWLIGTEHLLEYGLQYDIPRVDKREVRLSYHAYKIPGKSIVESVIQNLDGVQLAFIRMQNAVATAAPSGVAIEWKSLQNISLGEQGEDDVSPLQLLEIRTRTGDLIYSASTHKGQYVPNAARPIQELKGGAGAMFSESITSLDLNLQLIGDVIGIYRETVGLPAAKGVTATAVETALISSDLVLGPIYGCFKFVRQSMSINTILRGGIVIKYNGGYKLYHPALGASTDVMMLTPDHVVDELGIEMVIAPDEAQKERIHIASMQSMNKNKEGQAGITMGDYLMVMNVVEEGSIEWAEALLNHRIAQSEEKQNKRKNESIVLQNQGLVQLEQQKLTNELAKIEAEQKAQQAREIALEKEHQETERIKHKHKMEEIAAQGGIKMAADAQASAAAAQMEVKETPL